MQRFGSIRLILRAGGKNWISVKIRYQHEPAPATVELIGPDRVRIRFDEPQRAITPGQAAVFYDGDEVLGGGWIRAAVAGR